jgi:hypothetical protein
LVVNVDGWLLSSDEFLGAARSFIKTTDNSAFLRGIRGEVLTLRQLLRTCRDQLSDPSARLVYRGSSKADYDILLSVDGKEIRVDAKEKSEGDHWVRAHARNYATVTTNKKTGYQHIRPRTDIREGFYYVFVDSVAFPDTGEAKFFVLSDREAKTTLSEVYRKARAAHGNKRRRRNPDSDDFWIYPMDLQAFSDDRLARLAKDLR